MHSLSASMATSAIACTQVQLRIYDISSQKWKWLGDWKDL